MPLQYIQLRPGVSRESTNLANSGGWYDCDKIRFKSGLPQKLGGWVPYVAATTTSYGTYLGVARNMAEFVSLSGYYILQVGTNSKYYALLGGVYWDITPLRAITGSYPAVGYPPALGSNPVYSIYGTLAADISSTDTTLTVSSGTAFTRVYPYVITIGSEQIYVTSASGTSLLNCIRGYNGTTAAAHATSATITSSYLAINSPSNGAQAGDYVTLSGLTSFSVYTTAQLNAEFSIVGVASSYICVDSGVQSTSSTSGGGASGVAYYQIHAGEVISVRGNGWGAGSYSRSTWNSGYSEAGTPTSFTLAMRLWSADNFGQAAIFNPRGGCVYYWDSGDCIDASGRLITSDPQYPEGRGVNILDLAGADGYAPAVGNYVFVTDQRHIVVLGGVADPVTPGTTQDPMMIQWSNQEDPLIWDPSDITNSAGYQRMTYGSEIITAEKTRQEVLIFTDQAIYSMQYVGAPYVFGFNVITNEITIVSQNCVTTSNNITYWMGQDKFYVYSGRVDTLPCSLRQYIFDDFNSDQADQVVAGTNEKYNEVWWFYPSKNSDINDRYVIYNYLERLWYYGNLSRTAWLDSHIVGNPLAASNNIVYQHEVGLDDGSVNPPVAFNAYIESADFDLGEGDHFSFVRRVIPDVDFIGSSSTAPSVRLTIAARDFPGQGPESQSQVAGVISAPVSSGATAQVYNYTNQVWIRLRGRQVSFRVESGTDSTDVGVAWQLGTCRLDVQRDGRRGAM